MYSSRSTHWSKYYIPGAVLSSRDTGMNKTPRARTPHENSTQTETKQLTSKRLPGTEKCSERNKGGKEDREKDVGERVGFKQGGQGQPPWEGEGTAHEDLWKGVQWLEAGMSSVRERQSGWRGESLRESRGGCGHRKGPGHTGLAIVGSKDQQQCHVGACWQCSLRPHGPMSPNLHVNKLPVSCMRAMRNTDQVSCEPYKNFGFH